MHRVYRVYLIVAGLMGGLSFAIPRPGGAILAVLTGVSSVVAVAVSLRLHRPARRRPWVLIAVAIATLVLADALFDLVEPAGASWIDILWLAAYVPLGAGLMLMADRIEPELRRTTGIDALIVGVAVVLAQWELVARPVLLDADTGLLDGWVNVSYVVLDVALLAVLLRFMVVREWMVGAYGLLGAGVLAMLVADTVYLRMLDTYEAGSPLDALWLACYVLAGAAALHPSVRRLAATPRRVGEGRTHRHRIALMGAALLVSPVLLGAEVLLSQGELSAERILAIGAAAVLSLLSMWRVLDVVRHLERARAGEAEAADELAVAHAELARQHEQLQRLDHVKDELIGSVSHEFRTPLTSIRGHAGLIAATGPLADQQQRSLDVVTRNAKRLTALVDDLMMVARMQGGHLQVIPHETDLALLAEQAVEAIRPAATAKGVALALDAPLELTLPADPGRVAEILDNLLSNAVKFTDAGGRVSVEVGLRPDDTAAVVVRDTGMGVAADELPFLFDRFQRSSAAVERHIQGTGLGLHIAQGLAQAHGGHIEVVSVVGEGTAFTVVLPCGPRAASPAEDPAARTRVAA